MRVIFTLSVLFFIWVLYTVAQIADNETRQEARRQAATVQEGSLVPAE